MRHRFESLIRIFIPGFCALGVASHVLGSPPGSGGVEIWVDGPAVVQPGIDRDHPDAAVDIHGNSLFVWGAGEIYLRQFDDAGNALTDPIQVNTTTLSTQSLPRLAVSPDGSFLVVWQSQEPDPELNNQGYPWIRSQAFDGDLQPIGTEHLLFNRSAGGQLDRHADVAALKGGGYVVVWAQVSAVSPDTNRSILGRMIHADGTPNGEAFVVNATIGGSENDSSVTSLDDGGFLVVWEQGLDVYSRRFDASGTALTGDVKIDTLEAGRPKDLDATLASDGRVFVVWQVSEGISGDEVRGRMFSRTLDSMGDDFRINQLTEGTQGHARAAAYGVLGFLVVWESPESAGTDVEFSSIQGRLVTGPNVFDAGQFQVNKYEPGGQYDPAIGGNDGSIAIGWGSAFNAESGNDDVITGQSWYVCGIFCDGFEQ